VKPEDVTDDQLDRIENAVGMGHKAWDCVDPKEIIAAAVSVVNADNLKTLLNEEKPKASVNAQIVNYPHMCVKCNRNTNGCDRVVLREAGEVVKTMHAECAFDERWDADAYAVHVEPEEEKEEEKPKAPVEVPIAQYPKFARLGQGGSVLRRVGKPSRSAKYLRDAGLWSVYGRYNDNGELCVVKLKEPQLPKSIIGTLLIPASRKEWQEDNAGYIKFVCERDFKEDE
jgi:hypothetical protein